LGDKLHLAQQLLAASALIPQAPALTERLASMGFHNTRMPAALPSMMPRGSVALTSMADFVKNYQTLIVGVLGFIGVIATLVLNAWLARKAEQRRITHETKVLRTRIN
jgi:hypothetical protein